MGNWDAVGGPASKARLESFAISTRCVAKGRCPVDKNSIHIDIPAKPLSRRRQNCHSSPSNFAPRAGETRFFLFLSSKKCILTCGHQWIWARPFCLAGAVIYDLAKKMYCIFAGRRATFCVFGRFWIVFFCVFFLLVAAPVPSFGGVGVGA